MTSRRRLGLRDGERGQVLVLFVAVISIVFIVGAIAIDYGLWLSERRGMARATDLGALAAAQDLPEDAGASLYTSAGGACAALPSCEAAFDWAARNGYGEGDATVRVSYFCGNTLDQAVAQRVGVCFNENRNNPAFFLSPCPTNGAEVGCDAINLTIEKEAVSLFSQFFGGVTFSTGYSSWANVSFKITPLDTAVGVDATGSMQGNPIVQARNAANNFVDILLETGAISQVGYAPYRDCYGGGSGCVPNSNVIQLSTNKTTLHNAINATTASGATNICLGLSRLRDILNGPGATTDPDGRHFAVILTDGDNYYRSGSNPPAACAPQPAQDNNNADCTNSTPTERNMDERTWDMAQDMEDDDIEIYVIGFSVCGSQNNGTFTDGQCDSQIGNSANDNTADRRLLKCIASSTNGTNDHYFEVNSANELPNIFQVVAYKIAGRGLTAVEN